MYYLQTYDFRIVMEASLLVYGSSQAMKERALFHDITVHTHAIGLTDKHKLAQRAVENPRLQSL